MGFVNQTAGYDQKKVRKYGKLYGSIDFELNDKYIKALFRKQ
tara:strand:+ start:603 stop:728 length:126 start_codon:yes stop_codon:yes gene_type:complete